MLILLQGPGLWHTISEVQPQNSKAGQRLPPVPCYNGPADTQHPATKTEAVGWGGGEKEGQGSVQQLPNAAGLGSEGANSHVPLPEATQQCLSAPRLPTLPEREPVLSPLLSWAEPMSTLHQQLVLQAPSPTYLVPLVGFLMPLRSNLLSRFQPTEQATF